MWEDPGKEAKPAVCACVCLCRYWANLKLWFKQKISKEEFDLEAHRLLTQDNGEMTAGSDLPCWCFPRFAISSSLSTYKKSLLLGAYQVALSGVDV